MATQKPPQAEAANSANSHAAEFNSVVILTKQDAAAFLRCTVRYIERAIKSGRLRACKPTGKLVRIYRRDLDAFLESGATIGGAQ